MTSAAPTCSQTKARSKGKRDATVAALDNTFEGKWSDLGVGIETWEGVLEHIMSEAYDLTEWETVSLNRAQGWFKENLAQHLTNEEVVVNAELLEQWLVDFNDMRATLRKWSDLLMDLDKRLFSDFGKTPLREHPCATINLNSLSDFAETTFEDFADRSYGRAAKKWAPFFFKSAPCRVV